MAESYVWCPSKECTPYKAPEQLCDVCAAVRQEIKRAVREVRKPVEEPEILMAAKNMMKALRWVRDHNMAEWDAIMKSGESGVEMSNAWSRLKTAIIVTEREILSQ